METIAVVFEGANHGPLRLQIQEADATRSVLENLDATLKAHPGKEEVQLSFIDELNPRSFKLSPKVNISDDLIGELKALLGSGCLVQSAVSAGVK
jgi:DNA polymerase-3 subunit alpha